eukprot:CAMPEP_0174757010 /NCGR_PEP_ID=MMETSP1094-20130205/107042_1 /TAXON_ID=156173 /ORGANISM="Chrysochromulina brevifilum, Strain UTEX LB 985" /LENGTH=95 /DNA_ID=CAMNT_0015962927 /DNA_START=227 /DNA_END=511 /DNA_ORIENTATION=+
MPRPCPSPGASLLRVHTEAQGLSPSLTQSRPPALQNLSCCPGGIPHSSSKLTCPAGSACHVHWPLPTSCELSHSPPMSIFVHTRTGGGGEPNARW